MARRVPRIAVVAAVAALASAGAGADAQTARTVTGDITGYGSVTVWVTGRDGVSHKLKQVCTGTAATYNGPVDCGTWRVAQGARLKLTATAMQGWDPPTWGIACAEKSKHQGVSGTCTPANASGDIEFHATFRRATHLAVHRRQS